MPIGVDDAISGMLLVAKEVPDAFDATWEMMLGVLSMGLVQHLKNDQVRPACPPASCMHACPPACLPTCARACLVRVMRHPVQRIVCFAWTKAVALAACR